jgi:uncharacterized SAM-binding protein YcdF (DUF218 family)
LVVAAALAAWSLGAWAAAGWLVVREELPRADALAVLAGSATYVERAQRAAELYREGRAPRVVLTNDGLSGGYSAADDANPLFVERAARELCAAGVPADVIEVVPQTVSGTFDEVVRLRAHAEARGYGSLVVVTSGYQSRRALWTLRHVFDGSGIRVGVEPVETGRQTPRPYAWWLYPLGWRLVPGEYIKLAYYGLFY